MVVNGTGTPVFIEDLTDNKRQRNQDKEMEYSSLAKSVTDLNPRAYYLFTEGKKMHKQATTEGCS